MRTTLQLLALTTSLVLVSHAPAQDKLASPLEAATQPASDKPITAVPTTTAHEVQFILDTYLHGAWHSDPAGAQPELLWRAAPITVNGLSDTVLVEVSRVDSPADPFRVFVLQVLVRQNALRLRQFEFSGASGLKDALTGLTAAPGRVPSIELAALSPTLDMPLVRKNSGYVAATEHPFPTVRNGAIDMTASMEFGIDAIQIADAGFDAEGKQVWGQKAGAAIGIVPVHPQPRPVTPTDDGIVVVTTLAAPTAPKLEPNGEVVFHYTSWLTTGVVIETSRTPGHEPAKVRIPGNILPGLNKALLGIAKGERRKIIIPPELAYWDTGRAPIPPKATLIFDIECLGIDNSPATTVPPTSFNPHAAPNPGAAPTTPADPNAPIGSPPTNGGPETPRGGH